jgi:tight adherence protein B
MSEQELLAAVAGGLAGFAAVSAGEGALENGLVRARPLARAAAESVERLVAPLRLAGAEGVLPSDRERLRLQVAGAAGGLVLGWLVAGARAAPVFCIATAWVAGRAIQWRRAGYRRRVDAGAAAGALAIADALGAGHSVRGALIVAGGGVSGPAGAELRRVGRELELGVTTDTALDSLRRRTRSRRIGLIAAAVRIQHRSGGALGTLLREIAVAIEDQERLDAEARTASAQARFTFLVVLLLPFCGLVLGELVSPGIVARTTSSPAAVWLLGIALALQSVAVVVIRQLSRVNL